MSDKKSNKELKVSLDPKDTNAVETVNKVKEDFKKKSVNEKPKAEVKKAGGDKHIRKKPLEEGEWGINEAQDFDDVEPTSGIFIHGEQIPDESSLVTMSHNELKRMFRTIGAGATHGLRTTFIRDRANNLKEINDYFKSISGLIESGCIRKHVINLDGHDVVVYKDSKSTLNISKSDNRGFYEHYKKSEFLNETIDEHALLLINSTLYVRDIKGHNVVSKANLRVGHMSNSLYSTEKRYTNDQFYRSLAETDIFELTSGVIIESNFSQKCSIINSMVFSSYLDARGRIDNSVINECNFRGERINIANTELTKISLRGRAITIRGKIRKIININERINIDSDKDILVKSRIDMGVLKIGDVKWSYVRNQTNDYENPGLVSLTIQRESISDRSRTGLIESCMSEEETLKVIKALEGVGTGIISPITRSMIGMVMDFFPARMALIQDLRKISQIEGEF